MACQIFEKTIIIEKQLLNQDKQFNIQISNQNLHNTASNVFLKNYFLQWRVPLQQTAAKVI